MSVNDGCRGRVDFHAPGVPSGGFVFPRFESIVQTRRLAEVPRCLAELERAQADGYHAVGFVCYEAARAFDPAFETAEPGPLPLLWFGLLRDPAEGRSRTTSGEEPANLAPSWSYDRYSPSCGRILGHITAGNIYQANLTFPLIGTVSGDTGGLYHRLSAAQSSAYCGYVEAPEWSILSISPELFFTRIGRRITTKPMKGTRPRGMTNAEDERIARELMESEKDRAENLMIVDLLRNDVGRVAAIGTVRVPELFCVERYPTVWQMTSTVTAELGPGAGLPEIFGALFPCGSVTGAPKVRAMRIIAEEERRHRGVYCGCFGYLAPGGDCVFNVTIRTLTVMGEHAEYPVGSGIVADSDPADEYEECLAKARILERRAFPSFRLLETILWTPGAGYALLDRHLARLADSAGYFGFPVDAEEARTLLVSAAAGRTTPRLIRILADRFGGIEIEDHDYTIPRPPIRTVRIAPDPVSSRDRFLYHKTTNRSVYERAAAGKGGADDVLLCNERGEVTESTVANLAILKDGEWLTPPVESGLLAGTLRGEFIDAGVLREGVVTPDDLSRAEEIHLLNSVRGRFPVVLVP